jgi:hypothetical protein
MSGMAASRLSKPTMISAPQTDERSHDFRKGNADMGEAAGAQNIGEHQLLYAFGQEHLHRTSYINEINRTDRIWGYFDVRDC